MFDDESFERKESESAFNGFNTDEEGYSYAYNEGHSDSRKKSRGYHPNPVKSDLKGFKGALRQRAESFSAEYDYEMHMKEPKAFLVRGGWWIDNIWGEEHETAEEAVALYDEELDIGGWELVTTPYQRLLDVGFTAQWVVYGDNEPQYMMRDGSILEDKKYPFPYRVEEFGAETICESFGAEEQGKKTKDEIIRYLLRNCNDEEDYSDPIYHTVNDKNWTIADLFIRQKLNNGCDGFGMENVHKVYDYLVDNKEQLIEYNLVSKDGINNSGFPLWANYDFEAESFSAEMIQYELLVDKTGKGIEEAEIISTHSTLEDAEMAAKEHQNPTWIAETRFVGDTDEVIGSTIIGAESFSAESKTERKRRLDERLKQRMNAPVCDCCAEPIIDGKCDCDTGYCENAKCKNAMSSVYSKVNWAESFSAEGRKGPPCSRPGCSKPTASIDYNPQVFHDYCSNKCDVADSPAGAKPTWFFAEDSFSAEGHVCERCGGEVRSEESYGLPDDEEAIKAVKEGKAGECIECGYFMYFNAESFSAEGMCNCVEPRKVVQIGDRTCRNCRLPIEMGRAESFSAEGSFGANDKGWRAWDLIKHYPSIHWRKGGGHEGINEDWYNVGTIPITTDDGRKVVDFESVHEARTFTVKDFPKIAKASKEGHEFWVRYTELEDKYRKEYPDYKHFTANKQEIGIKDNEGKIKILWTEPEDEWLKDLWNAESFSADGKSKSGECYSCGEKGIHALSKKLTEDGNCPNCGALQEICDECGITGNPDVGWEGHGGIEIGVFVEAYDNEGKRISPKDAPEVGEGSFCIPCVEKWRKMGVRFEYDEWGAESFSASSGKRMYCPKCEKNRTWMRRRGGKSGEIRLGYICKTCKYEKGAESFSADFSQKSASFNAKGIDIFTEPLEEIGIPSGMAKWAVGIGGVAVAILGINYVGKRMG